MQWHHLVALGDEVMDDAVVEGQMGQRLTPLGPLLALAHNALKRNLESQTK